MSAIALVGQIYMLIMSLADRKALRMMKINHLREYTVKTSVFRGVVRIIIQSIFLSIGIGTVFLLKVNTPMLWYSYLFLYGFISAIVLLAIDASTDAYRTRQTLRMIEKLET